MSLKFLIIVFIKIYLSETLENVTESNCNAPNLSCSNKCVSFYDFCDGIGDCNSWEDENENICIKNTCPDYAFRCSYGACIDGDKKCDGIKDCTDNSDENEDTTCLKPRVPIQSEFDESCGEFDWPDTKKPFPWHAAVWKETNDGPQRICAGTIITKYHVITAVECFWDRDLNELDNSNTYTITAGIDGERFSQNMKVKSVDYHKSYDSKKQWQRKTDNIAIVTVEIPFVFNELVQAVCVSNETTELETKKYTMISWNITVGDDGITEPKQIYMEERHEQCWSMIDEDSVTDSLYETELLCMAADVCGHSNDIGAGVFDFTNNLYYLRGVLSYNHQSNPEIFEYCNYQIFTNINDDIPLIKSRIITEDTCPSNKFHCDSKCIDVGKVCDENVDCTDGSDEEYFRCLRPSFPIQFPDDNFTCGETGKDDGITPFPWHAAVYEETENGPNMICAATLVTSIHVLTDLECFWNPSRNKLKEANFTVTAGFNANSFVEFRKVLKIHYDNEYSYYGDWQQIYNNIAVVEVEFPFEFGEYIQPVCLDGRLQHEQTYFKPFWSQMVSWNIKLNETDPGETRQISVLAPTIECWNSITPNDFYRPSSSLLCSVSEYCGTLNDVGTGMFTKVNGKFYYRGMLTKPPRLLGDPFMPCANRMHVSIIPNIPFIEKTISYYYDGSSLVEYEDKNITYCNDYEVQCDDGGCISEFHTCNGRQECSDNSDESSLLCDEKIPVLFEGCGKFDTENDTKPFPWHVAIWKETETTPKRICSGTIISPNYVISAVDCFWNTINDSLSEDKFTVTAGYNKTYFLQYKFVSEIYMNDYEMRNGNEININNIALLKLESPLMFNENVNAICITPRFKSKLYANKESSAKFVGWIPNGFKIGTLLLLRNSYCRKNIPKYFLPEDNTKYCTGLYPCLYIVHYLEKAEAYNECSDDVSHLIGQCGLLSNHGGGMFLELNGTYYLKGILDPAFDGYHSDVCKYNIYNDIGPFIDYLYSIVDVQ